MLKLRETKFFYMISVNNFKPGITFQENNDIFIVLNASHSKQGRGQANIKAKVKNLRSGVITIKSYVGGEKVKEAFISKKDAIFLYSNSSNLVLMDEETFEQFEIPIEKIKKYIHFIKEGSKIFLNFFNKEIIDINLPLNVKLKVKNAPDAVKGNTTSNPQKKVVLETNYELEVPMFIKENDQIIVSTETGKYVGKGN